ncbi:MAG: GNAT family N-acetyltransferase [Rubripirellula sp.]|nr:GNAT family N-acetyltransferase [Rubripirellula sp.]
MYSIRRIGNFSQLKALRCTWDSVANETPFSSWSWFYHWAENYIQPDQLYTIVAETDAGELVGILPLYMDQSVLGGRTLRFLGSGEVCTDYLSLFTSPGHRIEVASAIAQHLSSLPQTENDGWDSIVLDHVHDDDVAINEFVEAMQVYGNELQSAAAQNCWRIELPDSWDKYIAMMSKSHRKQLRRVDRALIESGKATLHTAKTDVELRRAMEILVYLHQKRRNQLGQPGCFSSEPFSNFLTAVAADLLTDGTLRLHWVEVDGWAVAAEFQVTDGTTVFAYQAGIDPDVMDLEPGRLIMIATIRDAIASGYQAVDFLRGDEPYKAHFRAKPRATRTSRIVASSQRAQVHHAMRSATTTVKNLLKSTKDLVSNNSQSGMPLTRIYHDLVRRKTV